MKKVLLNILVSSEERKVYEKEKTNVLCYLRTHRRVWGLTVKELASLIGLRSASHMSRIEHGKRAPKVEVALACQVIFGIPPSAMFPHVYTLVEDGSHVEHLQLHSALEKTTSLSGLRKRELCELVLKRATGKTNPSRRNMNHAQPQNLVLSIYPFSRGFAFVFFEGSREPF